MSAGGAARFHLLDSRGFDATLDGDRAVDVLLEVLAPDAIDSDERDVAELLALDLLARAATAPAGVGAVGIECADGYTITVKALP